MRKELHQVHFIRAIASLGVMVTHFSSAEQLHLPFNFFRYGYLGVHLFFVLSGFIICYSLPEDYKLYDFKTFLVKRLVRIEPAYISSIILILGLNFISYTITKYQGNEFIWKDFLYHLAYLSNFGLGNYYNTNYWTLGIEFQYYLIIGIIFPFFSKKSSTVILFLIAICLISCLNFNRGPTINGGIQIILPFFSIFGIGIATFFFQYKKNISLITFLSLGILLLIQVYLFFDIPTLMATILAGLILMFWEYKHPIIQFFSKISFSLYLIHFPIGMKVINLGLRFGNSNLHRYILYCLAVVVSIFSAYIFYLVIEKPSFRWAKKIVYK